MQLYFNKKIKNYVLKTKKIMLLSLHYGNEKVKEFGISQLIKH